MSEVMSGEGRVLARLMPPPVIAQADEGGISSEVAAEAEMEDASMLRDSLVWLSFHVPKCVRNALVTALSKKIEAGRSHSCSDIVGLDVPHAVYQKGALLIIDISGFTKLSTMLDLETLSTTINEYFETIVSEVTDNQGDVVKIAGDALFVWWGVDSSASGLDRGLSTFEECVLIAAECSCRIVARCSQYTVPCSSGIDGEIASTVHAPSSDDVVVLDLHCGLAAGDATTLHVGDDTTKREFLLLGQTVHEASAMLNAARKGEVFASVEVLAAASADWPGMKMEPGVRGAVLARREECLVALKPRSTLLSFDSLLKRTSSYMQRTGSVGRAVAHLDIATLHALHAELSLYVHPVVRAMEMDELDCKAKRGRDLSCRELLLTRQLAEAELRVVYTLFVQPLVDVALSGDAQRDAATFRTLNAIMRVTVEELSEHCGQLRQYILDDKGLVLIATFGLRGSTAANMVPTMALPATVAISKALEAQLAIKTRIGATLGPVYCGVVGGVQRHEFAVLGPSVNLAARLMGSPDNPGVLVDNAVRRHASRSFSFKALPPVQAKGYEEPVPIFEPLNAKDRSWGRAPQLFGREREVEQLVRFAEEAMLAAAPVPCRVALLTAESGTGKSTLAHAALSQIWHAALQHGKTSRVPKSVVAEAERLVPLSAFKPVLLEVIGEAPSLLAAVAAVAEQTLSHSHAAPRSPRPSLERHASAERASSFEPRSGRTASATAAGFARTPTSTSTGKAPGTVFTRSATALSSACSEFSLNETADAGPTLALKLILLCSELGLPEGFAEVVGTTFLGLEDGDFKEADAAVAVGLAACNEEDETAEESGSAEPKITDVSYAQAVDFAVDAFLFCTEHCDVVTVAIDDVQWMDSMSWGVVERFFARAHNVCFVLLSWPPEHNRLDISPAFWELLQANARAPAPAKAGTDPAPEASEGSARADAEPSESERSARFLEMRLGSLEEGMTRRLLAHRLGGAAHEVEDSLCGDIHKQSQGNAYFAGEMITHMRKLGMVGRTAAGTFGWQQDAGHGRHARTPSSEFTSLNQLFLHRFDGLDSYTRGVLQLCAVLGRSVRMADLWVAMLRVQGGGAEEDAEARAALVLRLDASLDAACKEGVLVDSYSGGGCAADESEGLGVSFNLSLSARSHAEPAAPPDTPDARAHEALQRPQSLSQSHSRSQSHGETRAATPERDAGARDPASPMVMSVAANAPGGDGAMALLSPAMRRRLSMTLGVTRGASTLSSLPNVEEEGGERRLSFSHELWRTMVLGTMLKSRKRDLHAAIAAGLRHKTQESEGSKRDVQAMVTLFEHLRDSGNTREAVAEALRTGKRFEEFGLSQYAYEMYNRALDMYRHPAADPIAPSSPAKKHRRCSFVALQDLLSSLDAAVLASLGATEVADLVTLNVELGKVLANMGDGKCSALAYKQAYQVWASAPAAAEIADRTMVFPIISGICLALKWGNIADDAACSYERALVQRFVDESRADGDAVHVARAIAMQTTLLARLGALEEALAAQRQLEAVYTVALSPGICKAYGSDRAAQSYGLSTLWYSALGREREARAQLEHVLAALLPCMEPRNVHNTFMILFPILWELRTAGEALRARDLFRELVVDKFRAHFAADASTFFKSYYKLIDVLLGLAGGMWSSASPQDVEERQELADWVLAPATDDFAASLELGAVGIGRDGKGMVAETCLLLAKLRPAHDPTTHALLQKGLKCAEASLDRSRGDPAFAYACKGVEPVLAELQALLARTAPGGGREEAADGRQDAQQ